MKSHSSILIHPIAIPCNPYRNVYLYCCFSKKKRHRLPQPFNGTISPPLRVACHAGFPLSFPHGALFQSFVDFFKLHPGVDLQWGFHVQRIPGSKDLGHSSHLKNDGNPYNRLYLRPLRNKVDECIPYYMGSLDLGTYTYFQPTLYDLWI